MLRSSILSLVGLVLWTSGCSAQQGPPSPPSVHPRQQGKPGKPNRITKIFNSGPSENIPESTFIVSSDFLPKQSALLKKDDPLLSQDAALGEALEKARDQVKDFLHEQKLGRDWKPKTNFIRDRLLADLSKDEIINKDPKGELNQILVRDRIRAFEETRTVVDEGNKTENRRVWIKVAINADNWKLIQKEIRQAEDESRLALMRNRMAFLVKFLAGIVALLGTICGYLRLDEWSKGYYTKWLRLAAIGCVGAVTVFLWFLVAK
jgi:hypothetical protein